MATADSTRVSANEMIISFFIIVLLCKTTWMYRSDAEESALHIRLSFVGGGRCGVFDPFGFVLLGSWGLACHGTSRHAHCPLSALARPSRKGLGVYARTLED